MEWFNVAVDIFLHLDKHLGQVIQDYGTLTYLILFVIIFMETGLVVTPFLPGDSLLFAVGVFSATGDLNMATAIVLLAIAAILGDTVNYWIGHLLGPRIFRGENVRFLNRKHLERTHEFFERYGGKTIILARFVPIVRTFAPFVAGMGSMTYVKFIAYNVIGGIAWVVILSFFGYWFGGRAWVRENFSLVTIAIIVISVLPMVYEFVRYRIREAKQKSSAVGV